MRTNLTGKGTPRSKGPDVLLINPGGHKRIYNTLAADLAAVEPPIWAGLLAGFVQGQGYSVEILDANAAGLSPAETAAAVKAVDPLLTAVVVYGHNPSASTQVMVATRDICEELTAQRPTGKILLLGGHVAALPERTLREENVDFVCDGEGPFTLTDLLGALRDGDTGDLARVRGLCYLEGGQFRQNAPAPLVMDLTGQMPGMTWDLLPMSAYRAHNWHCFGERERQPYGALYTTLGCPFTCHFCCIQAPFKRGEAVRGYRPQTNSYRRWSPAAVVAQIDTLVQKYGITNIKFADEIFLLHRGHVTEICDLLAAREYDLNIWAYARVDTIPQDGLLDKLRAAGIRWLALGIESACDRVIDDVEKGYDPAGLTGAIGAIKDAGIHIIANYIFGLPEDDHASMRATLNLAQELNTEFSNFNCAMAYPGSGLYQDARRDGLPLPESWDGYSQYSRTSLPLPTRHLSGAQVLAFRDRAFTEYFSTPGYKEMVGATFGEATVREIEAMTARKLPRNSPVQPSKGPLTVI